MFVSSVGIENAKTKKTTTATKIGGTVGLGVGTAYLIKNKQDIFVNTMKASTEKFGSKKFGIIGAVFASGITLLASTGLGVGIANFASKVSDAIKLKKMEKETKQMLVEVLQKGVDEKNNPVTISVEELNSLLDE